VLFAALPTAVQEGPVVSAAATSMAAVPMGPFGVVTTGDGRWAFVSLTGPRTIGVLKVAASPVPSLIRQVPVAAAGLLGEALTPGDRYLLVADAKSRCDCQYGVLRGILIGIPGF
jgi:hypothetical protein